MPTATAYAITEEEPMDDHYPRLPCAVALTEKGARQALIELAGALIVERKLPSQKIELRRGVEPTDIYVSVGGVTFEARQVPLFDSR